MTLAHTTSPVGPLDLDDFAFTPEQVWTTWIGVMRERALHFGRSGTTAEWEQSIEEECAHSIAMFCEMTYQDALADIRATLRNQPGRVASYEELLVVTRLYRIGAQDRQENVA